MEKIFNYIDQNLDRFMEELFVLLRQPSINARWEGVEECSQLKGPSSINLSEIHGYLPPTLLCVLSFPHSNNHGPNLSLFPRRYIILSARMSIFLPMGVA